MNLFIISNRLLSSLKKSIIKFYYSVSENILKQMEEVERDSYHVGEMDTNITTGTPVAVA